MGDSEFFVDIEVYDTDKNKWAQAKYCAHSVDDILWTDDLFSALNFIAESIKENQ